MSASIRDTVLRSLSAVGAIDEAHFYADLFSAQDAERFALIVLDPRCLKDPLLESLIGNLRILSDLGLSPILLVGALDHDRVSVKFQAQRLFKDLGQASVKTAKLNTASYQLIPDVRKKARNGMVTILEMTERRGKMNLMTLVTELKAKKVIFLQPSGGITLDNKRLSNINLDQLDTGLVESLSAGQMRFIAMVQELSKNKSSETVYVIASPLNLLAELFTAKGAGTMIRRAATIKVVTSLSHLEKPLLQASIEEAFNKVINPVFLRSKIHKGFIEEDYRGGAIFTKLIDLPYLSKFWVTTEARGEGIARDIWDSMIADIPSFFWRSRMGNPFNYWYMRTCDGMQISGEWRVFWKGLDAAQIPDAIQAAATASDDFLTQ